MFLWKLYNTTNSGTTALYTSARTLESLYQGGKYSNILFTIASTSGFTLGSTTRIALRDLNAPDLAFPDILRILNLLRIPLSEVDKTPELALPDNLTFGMNILNDAAVDKVPELAFT